jgi:hypothetical protein
MASGQVLTSAPAGQEGNATQSPFSNSVDQYWDFIDVNGNPASWAPWDPFALVADNYGTATIFPGGVFVTAYFLNLAGGGPYQNGNTVISYPNLINRIDGNAQFRFFGAGNGYYNVYLSGQPLVNNAPPYLLGIWQTNPTCTSNCWPSGAEVRVVTDHGYANERWHLVPYDNVYTGN